MFPEGFVVPIHASLTKPMLIGGVPREIAIINWTFVAAMTLPLGTWYAIPLGIFVHVVALAAAKKDPQFFDVFRRAWRYKKFYKA